MTYVDLTKNSLKSTLNRYIWSLKTTFDFQESRGVYEIQCLPSHSFQLKQLLHYIYSNKKRIIQYLFQWEKILQYLFQWEKLLQYLFQWEINIAIFNPRREKYYNIYSQENFFYNIYCKERKKLQYLFQQEKNIIFIPTRKKYYNIYSYEKLTLQYLF